MDKIPNGSNVITQLFGERSCFTHSTPHSVSLAHRLAKNQSSKRHLDGKQAATSAIELWHFDDCDRRPRFRPFLAFAHPRQTKAIACFVCCRQRTTSRHMAGSTYRLFFYDLHRLRQSVIFLIDIHLKPAFRDLSHTRKGGDCQPLLQEFFNQVARCLVNGLTTRRLDKLALTVLATKALLALVSVSVFDNS